MEMCNSCGIVFDDKECPCCSLKDQVKDLESEVERLRNELDEKEN